LVALSTGTRLRDITETLEITEEKGIIYFTNEVRKIRGIILELDIETVQGYLVDIKNHYRERIARDVDISTGLRGAIKKLNIAGCGNINHLNELYRACLTTTEQ